MRILFCNLIFIFLFFACNSKYQNEYDFLENFENRKIDSVSIIDTTDYIVDFIPSMIKLKNYLVFSQFTGDTIFTCIDLLSEEKFNFGVRGRGKNEFSEGYGLEKINDSTMFIFDRVFSRLILMEIDSDSIIFKQNLKVSPFMLDVHYGNDSLYFVTATGNLEKNYGIYNVNKDEVIPYIDYPKGINDHLSEMGKSRIYYSHIVRKPGSLIFAAFKDKHHIVDILKIEDDSLVLVKRRIFSHFKWFFKNKICKPIDENAPRRVFTSKLLALQNYICALYKVKDLNYIMVFDWLGTPLYSYEIPYHLIGFTGDENFLYGIAAIGEKYHLVRFSLKLD